MGGDGGGGVSGGVGGDDSVGGNEVQAAWAGSTGLCLLLEVLVHLRRPKRAALSGGMGRRGGGPAGDGDGPRPRPRPRPCPLALAAPALLPVPGRAAAAPCAAREAPLSGVAGRSGWRRAGAAGRARLLLHRSRRPSRSTIASLCLSGWVGGSWLCRANGVRTLRCADQA